MRVQTSLDICELIRHKCLIFLEKLDSRSFDRVFTLRAAAALETKVSYDTISAQERIVEVIQEFFPRHIWYNKVTNMVSTEEPQPEETKCTLCEEMEWDEAIYCPQCFGAGVFTKENFMSKFDTASILTSNRVKNV